MWNLNRENGWEMYKQLTTDNNNLEAIISDSERDTTKIMKKIDNEIEKVKFRSFGKVTFSNTTKSFSTLKKLEIKKVNMHGKENKQDELKLINDEITREVMNIKKQELEKEFSSLQSTKTI